MRTSLRRPVQLIGVLLFVALIAAGCGDSEQDQAKAAAANARKQLEKLAADAKKRVDEASKNAGSSLGQSGTPKRHEFKTVDAKVRFVNTYADDGTASPIDIYFGDGDTGKKAVTLEYGEASDYLPVQVETDPISTPSDGSTELVFSAYLPGKTDIGSRLLSTTDKLEKGLVLTVLYTWVEGTGSSDHTSMSSTNVYDSKTQTPADGKAYVFKNENGISGITDGNYVTLAPVGTCDWPIGTDSDAGEVNGGTPYLADPGPVTVQVSEENTDCADAVTTVDLDLAAGDSWLVVMYGTDKADRAALPLQLATS